MAVREFARRWEEIAVEVSNETDAEKLGALAEELFRMLAERERTVQRKAANA